MLALVNCEVWTVTQGVINEGTIIIESGKIKEVAGSLKPPAEAEVIDLDGKIVLPGLVDAHTHLGIAEEGLGWEGRDTNEMTDPITPHLRALDGINPADQGFIDAYKTGVTTAMVAPGSANVLGGECTVVKTKGRTVKEMLVAEKVGIKAAMGENPKRVYSEQDKTPSTRMAVAGLLRKTLLEVEDYWAKKQAADDYWERDIKWEALAPVLNGRLPLKTHAHRADDIMTVLRIAEEFDLKLTLEHGTEGHKVADELAEAGVPVIVGPTLTARSKVELKERSFTTPKTLAEAGVKIALMSDHPASPIDNLLVSAARAVKAGLDKQTALEAVTINPAEILGVAARVGSIEAGKDADLVVFTGDPLEVASEVEMVLIEGEQVEE